MFHAGFYMNNRLLRLLILLPLAGIGIILYFAIVLPFLERAAASRSVRLLEIPREEAAYRNLSPVVMRRDEQWREFLTEFKSREFIFTLYKEEKNWGCWLDFENSIRD